MEKFPKIQTALGSLGKYFALPHLPEDEDAARAARRLNIITTTTFGVTLVYMIVWLLTVPESSMLIRYVAPSLIVTGVPTILVRIGRIQSAKYFFLGGVWLATVNVMQANGGTLAPIFSLFPLIVLTAALISNWFITFGLALLTILTGLFFVYQAGLGLVPPPIGNPLNAWLTQTVIIIISTIAISLVVRQNNQALRSARMELAERKKIEDSLRQSEERFRLISTVTSDYTFSSYFNAEGKLEINLLGGAFETILGYTQEEFVAKGSWRGILHPDDWAQDERDMAALRKNQRVTTEVRITRKDGEIRWVRVYANPLWDIENNRLKGINGAVRDVTERKQAQQALRESEKRYRIIAAIISDYAYAYDIQPDGSFTTAWATEESFMQLTGYAWGEVVSTYKLYHPDDVALAQQHVEQTAAGNATGGEYRIITKSGEVRWLQIQRAIEWDENHQRVIRFYGAARDITDHKHAEMALAQERKLLRTVIDSVPDNIYVKDKDGRFLLNNHESMRILGVSRQEDLLGKSDFDFFPHERAAQWHEEHKQLMEHGKPIFDIEVFQPWYSGRRRWISESTIPLYNDEGEAIGLLGINRDISQTKQAQEAIRQSESSMRALLDATTDVAFLISPDGTFITVNKMLAQLMNVGIDDLIGKNAFNVTTPNLRDERYQRLQAALQQGKPLRWEDSYATSLWDNSLYPILSPEGSIEAFAVYSRDITEQKRLASELQRYTVQLEQMVEERTVQLRRTKDQIEIILNNTSDAIALAQPNGDISTRNPAFMAVFGQRGSEALEHILWTVPNDDVAVVGNALMNVVYDQARQHVATQIIANDGNEKDIDLAFIPVQLADEVESPGILVSAHDITHLKEIERFKARFVADALHDLATPITGLSTRLYLLKRSPENLQDHVRALENQVEHLRNLLVDLRTLSQLDRGHLSLDLELSDLNEIVLRVFDTYEPVAISKQQALLLSADLTMPEIQLDSRQIERVLVNLISNAINYTPDGKTIKVQTLVNAENIIFSVSDEGIGIQPEELAHVFERFYRTNNARKTQSSGTGLGLAIVKEIVELHGGTVTITSQPGVGSTFTIQIPFTAGEA